MKKDVIKKYFMKSGYFSEYLPNEFSIYGVNLESSKKNVGKVKPYSYSMSKFNIKDHRRTIHIPELISYLAAIDKISEPNILDEILRVDLESKFSFSKLMIDNKVVRHSNHSDKPLSVQMNKGDENEFNYSSNLVRKIIASRGAKGILYLDIANFFGGFYTHNIPAIFKGHEWAMEQYKIDKNSGAVSQEYKKLKSIDSAVRNMNVGSSHGLLVGPFISKVLAETLMNTIDKEIEKENIKFFRFMDDYEIVIYEESRVDLMTAKIVNILHRYGFSLNNEKTKYISYPYSDKNDLTTIFDSTKKELQVINVFNLFIDLEITKNQKGSVKYLISRIDEFDSESSELIMSLMVNAITNNPNSVVIAIKKLINRINEKSNAIILTTIVDSLVSFLKICIDNKYDLEQIWLIYAILKIVPKHKLDFENLNELAAMVILCETNKLSKKYIRNHVGKCFLLDYELWRRDIISDKDFFENHELDENSYLKLKNSKFSFYKKQIEQ